MLGVERLGRALGVGLLHQLVVPVVAAVDHGHVVHPALHDDDVLDARRVGHRLVGGRLEREDVAAPVAAVSGDQHLRLGVVDAVGERLRREAAEHHAVGGADAGARQHRHGRLGDHRQVDVDPVTGLHAEALEHVGEALHLGEQLGVGDRPGVARLALEVDGDLVATAGGDVAVEAVVGDVELAADEPLGVGELPVADRLPLLRPVEQLGGLLGPEPFVVRGRLVVHERPGDQGVSLMCSGGGNVRFSAYSASIVSAAVSSLMRSTLATPDAGGASAAAKRRRRAREVRGAAWLRAEPQ